MKFLLVVSFLLCAACESPKSGSATFADLPPAGSNPVASVPTPTPVPNNQYRLIIDGQTDYFATGSVIVDQGLPSEHQYNAIPPTQIPSGQQFEEDFSGQKITIMGVSWSSGPNAMGVYLYRNGILVESGVISAPGNSYNFTGNW